MKKNLIVVAVIVSIFALIGCSKKTPEVNVSVNDIMKDIKVQIAEDMKNGGVPEEDFKDGQLPMYMEMDLTSETPNPLSEMINKDDIEEGIALQPMMNVKSDMIVVLKAKDISKVESLKTSLQSIKEQQNQIWERYLPDQYEKVKNNIILSNGKYLIYITYDDVEKIQTAYENALK
ncbi:DUF4358 domain-containing protein [Clostridium grantii]|uniref:DUF4358 domain-containing protein n=1 Tax=Clostridium grantii DSM 8605 TaxID=1121316 RepID=A0A1M5XVV4_9CLOT|nr:DUF4358 domain-containing protein [Clostridium grantii]SHI03674.1 protein of unknown function [Clostridium grantii DSM 8605]